MNPSFPDLKFDGLIVTDDMTMVAITNDFDISEACIKSINAGADLPLHQGRQRPVPAIRSDRTAGKVCCPALRRADLPVPPFPDHNIK